MFSKGLSGLFGPGLVVDGVGRISGNALDQTVTGGLEGSGRNGDAMNC